MKHQYLSRFFFNLVAGRVIKFKVEMYQTCSEKCEECIRLNKCYLTAQSITYSCPSCRHKLRAPNNPLCDGDTDEQGLVNLVFFWNYVFSLVKQKTRVFMCPNRWCCYVWDEGNECDYIKAKIELVRYSLLGTKSRLSRIN